MDNALFNNKQANKRTEKKEKIQVDVKKRKSKNITMGKASPD